VADQHLDAAVWLVNRSCHALDRENFEDYLALFVESGRYSIGNVSPEINKRQKFLDLTRSELEALLGQVSKHVREPNRRSRIATVMDVAMMGDGSVHVVSNVAIFSTDHILGTSAVYAVVEYHDELVEREGLRIRSRHVEMVTRSLKQGSIAPL